ncbi:hypothetical protein ACXYTJ_09415 [Gilvimarinus sp. F26214L]|uniref:hypothetical protein n=1 Tax=Gilvimarinus sp. DZF01 TaxID=3461371 RepID=UPI004045983C
MHYVVCWLSLSFALLGCGSSGGGSGSDEPPASSADGPRVLISGRLLYESVPPRANCEGLDYSNVRLRPIRGVTVEVVDAESGEVLTRGVSDPDGYYGVHVPEQRQVFVRARAELKQVEPPSWDVEVRDNTSNTEQALSWRPLYVLDSRPFDSGQEDRELHLTARSGWDGTAYTKPRAAAPFAILDTIYSAMDLVRSADPSASFPPLEVFWSTHNTTARTGGTREEQIARGEVGTSFYLPSKAHLFLLGKEDDDTEEFDSHVIAHEWGHYFETRFSRSDSPGGPHSIGEALDMRLAFSEGWATALAGMALDSPHYCDTGGIGQGTGFGIDLEHPSVYRSGWFNELSIVSIMYDLWDERPADDDGGSLGFSSLYEVFAGEQRTSPAFTSVFSFMSALKARNPGQAGYIDSLLGRHNITVLDPYGTGEQNAAGSRPDVLPVYADILANAAPVSVCSNSQFDRGRTGNKLSEHRYLRLSVDASGTYDITVTTANPDSAPPAYFGCNEGDPERYRQSDPDFYLVERGRIITVAKSCTTNREQRLVQLAAGEYLIDLSEFRFADGNTADDFPDRSCFDVTISPSP